MYVANDAYDRQEVIDQGIISREAYRNNATDYTWMTLLHYPRECTTPYVQRYTDPTRDYSVATGLRDGKGATIYFPNQGEYYRAYFQGTFGYLWNAWDTTRDDNFSVSSPSLSATAGHNQSQGQSKANAAYTTNYVDYPYTSFYDVTLGDAGTSTLTKPSGLEDYYKIYWNESAYSTSGSEEQHLYPQGEDYRGWHNNLMEYKETVESGKVHGEISKTKGGVGDDDVVIHKGVPYLIRPNLRDDAKRQFDFRPGERLHEKLKEEASLTGDEQKARVYAGEYTVPSYVINDETGIESVESAAVDFTMGDGTVITHNSGTIKYFGANVPYKISRENKYTFVGTLYKSPMPVNCYFLGWDSRLNNGKGGAAFWYNKLQDTQDWNWNNETGIIIPNFNTSLEIDPAGGPEDPARWIITGLAGDDIKTSTGAGAKKYSMLFGDDSVESEATGINEVSVIEMDRSSVYNLQGEEVGSSLRGLSKGVYIKNGKKYVVK